MGLIYTVLVIIAFTIGSLLTLKAYKQGLTHSWDLKQNRPPTEFKNPIAKIIDEKHEEKEAKRAQEIINEYLHDPRDDPRDN